MGRLSGFFIWSATFLLAVISVCRLPDELAQRTLPTHRLAGAFVDNKCARLPPTQETRSCDSTSAAVVPVPGVDQGNQIAVCQIVAPAGCMIIIGSVDISGAPHEVSVKAHHAASCEKVPAVSSNALRVEAEHRSLVVPSDAEMFETATKHASPFSEKRSGRLVTESTPALTAFERHRDSVNVTDPAHATQRRFLIPHFEADAVRQEPSLATAICSSRRVTVFLDDSLRFSSSKHIEGSGHLHSASAESADEVASAMRICELIETRLMDTISGWIHPVSDLDNDGRLAIVMTDLDRRSISGETPVLGCVRERDFLEHATADFAGDIVYLDHRLPQGDELAALLAHELTHAAAASLQLEYTAQPHQRSMRIQPWMNEAAAHWVELQFCEEPAGFSDRVRQFQANPAACPIVAPEALVPLATRRAGSRVSAVSFLQRFVNEPHNIHRLLVSQRGFDETMSDISGQPFDEIFRSWSIEQGLQSQRPSTPYPVARLSDGFTTTAKLHGTSFVVIRGGDVGYDVTITSRNRAKLQVTVLVSGGKDINDDQLTAADVD